MVNQVKFSLIWLHSLSLFGDMSFFVYACSLTQIFYTFSESRQVNATAKAWQSLCCYSFFSESLDVLLPLHQLKVFVPRLPVGVMSMQLMLSAICLSNMLIFITSLAMRKATGALLVSPLSSHNMPWTQLVAYSTVMPLYQTTPL